MNVDIPILRISADVLVVGGGIAALQAALAANHAGAKVRIASKRRLLTGGAAAAGRSEIMGVAAALGLSDSSDSPEMHFQDTVQAGGAFLRPDLVRVLVEEIPEEIHELLAWGVPFEKSGESLFQTKSDYATYPRNCKVDGRTGYEILSVIVQRAKRSEIEVDQEVMIAKLFSGPGQSLGAFGLGTKTNQVYLYETKTIVVACGGAGNLFSFNCLSPEMSGDGYVFALEAGAPLINMEFLQFGPGVLGPRVLNLSGPIYRLAPRFTNQRGEDILEKHLPSGISKEDVFTQKVFPFNAENASRYLDAAIFYENLGGRSTQIQVKHEEEFRQSAPHTCRRILHMGYSLSEPWPVGIVLQCFNGGIYMEDTYGRTKVPGLFAAGEAAGGLRAPTRPGGNALAETLVFGKRAGKEAAREAAQKQVAQAPREEQQAFLQMLNQIQSARRGRSHLQIRKEVQTLCEKQLSVVRSAEGLRRARNEIRELIEEIGTEAKTDGFLADFMTTRNLALVAEVLAVAADSRKETRGAHWRRDFDRVREEFNRPFFITQEGANLRVEAKKI